MIGTTDACRAVPQLRLVSLRVCYELLQIVGREIVARDQHQGLICNEGHRREIGHGVVKRFLVERLVLGVCSNIAEDELVPIGHRLRHAVRACHAAGAGDVFDNNRLMELAAQPVGDDASDGVGRSARGKGRHHGHRTIRPILRLCSR